MIDELLILLRIICQIELLSNSKYTTLTKEYLTVSCDKKKKKKIKQNINLFLLVALDQDISTASLFLQPSSLA